MTQIFQFSRSGGSSAVARALAARVEADLRPIRAEDETALPQTSSPRSDSDSIEHVESLVRSRNGHLSLGVSIRLGLGYSVFKKLVYLLFGAELRRDIQRDRETRARLWANCEERLAEIAPTIRRKEPGTVLRTEKAKRFMSHLVQPLTRSIARRRRYEELSGFQGEAFEDLTKMADASFQVYERCNGCGVCAKVCPVANIELRAGKPSWQHRCENCYRCFQWCPQAAIGGNIVEFEVGHQRADVTARDFYTQMS